jgi:hypothetical protein
MILIALALSLVSPASACAMPRHEMVVAPVPGPQQVAVADAPAQNLEDVLAEIDRAALIPEAAAAPKAAANRNATEPAAPTAAAPAS